MAGFIDWLKEHPMIALGAGAIAVFLVIRSVAQKNQNDPNAVGGGLFGSTSGSNPNNNLGGGQVVSAGGYTFVPTNASDTSSTTSGDVNPNTAADLQALSGFLQAFQAAPGGVTPPPATPAVPAGTGAPASATPPITVTNTNNNSSHNKKIVTTKHTHGTPNQPPGVPIVGAHPANPSPLPPTRMPPVMHPVVGANHPIGGPTGATVKKPTIPGG